jgi:hypothetical protein
MVAKITIEEAIALGRTVTTSNSVKFEIAMIAYLLAKCNHTLAIYGEAKALYEKVSNLATFHPNPAPKF